MLERVTITVEYWSAFRGQFRAWKIALVSEAYLDGCCI